MEPAVSMFIIYKELVKNISFFSLSFASLCLNSSLAQLSATSPWKGHWLCPSHKKSKTTSDKLYFNSIPAHRKVAVRCLQTWKLECRLSMSRGILVITTSSCCLGTAFIYYARNTHAVPKCPGHDIPRRWRPFERPGCWAGPLFDLQASSHHWDPPQSTLSPRDGPHPPAGSH